MYSGRLFLVVLFCAFILSAASSGAEECNMTELSFVPLKVSAKASSWSQPLDLYSFPGYQRLPSRLFLDAHLQINLTDKDVKIYQGDNCSNVLQQFNDDRRLFGLLRQFSVMRSKQLNPFDRTVVGIVTNDPYTVRVRVWEVNYMRAGAFGGAIILYLLSYSLVRNALFFYTSGCAVGVIASLLIVGFTVYRFAPKKWVLGIPLLFGGWSISLYSVYFLWKNFTSIVLRYQKFVAAYFATVIIISFAVCYRYGPPTDVRSHNLAQWALQLIALLIIYSSCQIDEISFAVIAILIFWSCTKSWIFALISKIFSFIVAVWRIFFPKTRRLLTLEEYEKQGEEETKKAMEQLRSFCRSPKADAWKITSSMSNPKRFASFVDGSSDHLTEEELRIYELESTNPGQLSDDSGEDELLFETRHRHLNETDRSGLRNRSYMSDGPVHSRWDRRQRFLDTDEEEDDNEGHFYERPRRDWDASSRSLPSRRLKNNPSAQSKRLESEYNGLLMPVPPRLPRSDPDQICSFYKLTEQQAAMYKFLRHRGMRRGNDYAGESEQTIKQSIPEEHYDEVEFDEDLARLVELNLINQDIHDGYWRIT